MDSIAQSWWQLKRFFSRVFDFRWLSAQLAGTVQYLWNAVRYPFYILSWLMQQLWKQGSAAGLQMHKIDYRREADAGGRFERLHISVPASGSYPAVRKFSFVLMSAFPSLALDGLDMTRDPNASGSVETTLHFSLFTRP